VSIGHYENFPVASLLCPPRLRPAVLAIYRFARTADDLADEGDASPACRRNALAAYRRALDRAAAGQPTDDWPEVFGPLRPVLGRHGLPMPLLHDLLDAFAQDCDSPLYRDRQHLLDYCRRSAHPIGRLLLNLYGVGDARLLAQSDAICSALQLINFWQDPSVDLARGRNYFPLQDLQRHGLRHDDLRAGRDTPATQAVVAEMVDWSRQLMAEGSPLATTLPGRIGWELRLVVQGGLRVLARIEALQFKTLGTRPTLRAHDLPGMLWRAARMPRPPSPGAKATA